MNQVDIQYVFYHFTNFFTYVLYVHEKDLSRNYSTITKTKVLITYTGLYWQFSLYVQEQKYQLFSSQVFSIEERRTRVKVCRLIKLQRIVSRGRQSADGSWGKRRGFSVCLCDTEAVVLNSWSQMVGGLKRLVLKEIKADNDRSPRNLDIQGLKTSYVPL
jgi:hypothetical protein